MITQAIRIPLNRYQAIEKVEGEGKTALDAIYQIGYVKPLSLQRVAKSFWRVLTARVE